MWRDTGQPVRVFMFDARALLPLICFVCYWSWITFYIAVVGVHVLFLDFVPRIDLANHVPPHSAPAGRAGQARGPDLEAPEAGMSGISVDTVSRTMEAALAREGRTILYHDQSVGADLVIRPGTAASPTGLLPVLVVAGGSGVAGSHRQRIRARYRA